MDRVLDAAFKSYDASHSEEWSSPACVLRLRNSEME